MYLNCETLTQRLKCSYEDKLECLEIVKYIIELSNIALKEGLLALEDESKKLRVNSKLLKKGLELIVDGTEPEMVEKYFLNNLASNNYIGKEFLKNFLIFKGVCDIQQGIPFYNIIVDLSSYFGIEFDHYFQDILNDELKKLCKGKVVNITNDEVVEKFKDIKPFSDSTSYLEEYKDLDNRSIQRIILEIDYLTLGYALSGASGKTRICFLTNMSQRLKELVLAITVDEISPQVENNIEYYQKRIVEVIKKLEARGEIYIPHK